MIIDNVTDNKLCRVFHLRLGCWWLVPRQIACVRSPTVMDRAGQWSLRHRNCLPPGLAWNWGDYSLRPGQTYRLKCTWIQKITELKSRISYKQLLVFKQAKQQWRFNVTFLTSCLEVLGSRCTLLELLFLLADSSSSSVSSSLAGQESIPVAARRTSGIWKSS